MAEHPPCIPTAVALTPLAVTVAQLAGSDPLRLHARAPSRFLTLEAATGGGSVSVEVIQEGSVRLSTRGGDISVPKVGTMATRHASPACSCGYVCTCSVAPCLPISYPAAHPSGTAGPHTNWHACMSAPPPAPPCLQVKAVDAHLTSGGGAIRGSVTGVDVRLRSGGGPVQLRSLVGKQVELSSGGGAVTLGACYADQLHLQSGE